MNTNHNTRNNTVMHGFSNGARPDQNAITSAFTFPATDAPLHIVDQNGEPWFVAKDVCDILGLTNITVALAGLDDDEKTQLKDFLSSHGGRTPLIINESGLYALILKSRKPQAKQFKKWITSVVLPAIRKDGGYILGEEKVLSGEMSDKELLARAIIMAKDKIERLTAENAALIPKAALFDQYLNTEGTLTLTESGKIMGLSGKSLGLLLRRNRWLFKSMKRVIPTQYAINRGWMIAVPIDGPSIDGKPNCYGRITKRGLEVLMEIHMEEAV